MNVFVRQTYTPTALLELRNYPAASHADYQKYRTLDISHLYRSPYFTTPALLAVLAQTLGDTATLAFLQSDAKASLSVAATVLDDHVRTVDRDMKDLQVNLVVNMVKEVVEAKNLPRASRYGYGEDLIRKCQFDNEFKYALKCALFDLKALDSPWIILAHYPPPVTDPSTLSKSVW